MNATHALIAVVYFILAWGMFTGLGGSGTSFRLALFAGLFWPLVLVIEVCKGGYEYLKGERYR